jgi:hypothetical protein
MHHIAAELDTARIVKYFYLQQITFVLVVLPDYGTNLIKNDNNWLRLILKKMFVRLIGFIVILHQRFMGLSFSFYLRRFFYHP